MPAVAIRTFLATIAIAFALCGSSHAAEQDCFRAAVYEHVLAKVSPYKDAVEANLQAFENATRTAKQKGADIVVFPEAGITPRGNRTNFLLYADDVPDPDEDVNPCKTSNRFKPGSALVKLSCMAADNGMYVVANIIDVKPCQQDKDPKCPKDGAYIYNTNVALARDGRLVARYHKVHPFFEQDVNAAQEPEYVFFDTEFGRMGTFICFDILYAEAAKLVRQYGIDTVVYPTWWFDELPSYSAHAVQQGFAMLHEVNLLAANIQRPRQGSLGSGLYSGHRGAVNYTHVADNQPKLLVARLPIHAGSSSSCDAKGQEETKAKRTGDAYKYTTSDFEQFALVSLKSGQNSETACHGGLCCHLQYNMKSNNASEDPGYYFGVHNGTKIVRNRYKLCEEICVLMKCKPGRNPPCFDVSLDTETTVFDHLTITGEFSTEYVLPSVVGKQVRLVSEKYWDYSVNRKTKEASLSVKGETDILSVTLAGRCFDRDPPYVQ